MRDRETISCPRAIFAVAVIGALGCNTPGGTAMASPREKSPASERPRPGALAAVASDAMCVTKGDVAALSHAFRVETPTTRAVVPGSSGEAARLRFTYRGETAETRALASGQIRHQVGIKLRAADGCNVVYVMWRVEPKPFIEVSVKLNPGKSTHAECGANGYTKIKPAKSSPVPAFEEGVDHTLEAAIDGDELVAKVDGEIVWRGTLAPGARDLVGPAGFRSDNVRFDGELETASGRATQTPGCAGGGDDD